MARLAKEWNSKVRYDGDIGGRSTIFELIGITAGRDEESKNPWSPSLVNAFRRFLSRVCDLKNQKIAYYEFYKETDVPKRVKSKKPLVLDPSNPFDDLMRKFPSDALVIFRDQARKSQSKLDSVQSVSDLEMLF